MRNSRFDMTLPTVPKGASGDAHPNNGFFDYCTSIDTGTDHCQNVFSIKELLDNNHRSLSRSHYDNFLFLQTLCEDVQASPIALRFLTDLSQNKWKITLKSLNNNGYHLNIDEKTLIIDSYGLNIGKIIEDSATRHKVLISFIKSLRDITQEKYFATFYDDYNAEDILQLERVRAADVDTVGILMLWQLRNAGQKSLWRHVLANDDGDLAKIFVDTMERFPSSLYNGLALAHVFRQWYAIALRVDGTDHNTLEYMDDALAEGSILGSKRLNSFTIEEISSLPDGIYYLDGFGKTIAKDPYFCGLNDPINQAHLFQIMYDSKVTYVSDIPFRDPALASKFSA